MSHRYLQPGRGKQPQTTPDRLGTPKGNILKDFSQFARYSSSLIYLWVQTKSECSTLRNPGGEDSQLTFQDVCELGIMNPGDRIHSGHFRMYVNWESGGDSQWTFQGACELGIMNPEGVHNGDFRVHINCQSQILEGGFTMDISG